ncbi:MAG: hypothetical protein WC229_01110 [Candidatus Paceibacterota bacterium]|jgi:uncharacterized BrkB/YihY/UPF0761 family membrane protein
MSKELKNITNDIMDQIHDEKIKIRPRVYFVLGSVLTFLGLVSSMVISIFSVGLIRFSLRSHGPMADHRLDQILSNFPWWVVAFAIIGLIVGVWLIHKYEFSFKVNFKVVIVLLILAVILGGWIVDSIGLNDVLARRGPMKGMMRQYMQDNNLQDGQDGGQRWGRNIEK